jgi:hypothetical protein
MIFDALDVIMTECLACGLTGLEVRIASVSLMERHLRV